MYEKVLKYAEEVLSRAIEGGGPTLPIMQQMNESLFLKGGRDGIGSMLIRAAEITELDELTLLEGLDFKEKDKTITALESFLAELRALLFINNLGGTGIAPIPSNNRVPSPDFLFKMNDKQCNAEVFCFTQIGSERKDETLDVYKLDPEKFVECYLEKAKEKKVQLDSSKDTFLKLLVCVINDLPYSILFIEQEYNDFLVEIHRRLGWGNEYCFSIVAGSKACTYPDVKLNKDKNETNINVT